MELDYTKVQEFMKEALEPEHTIRDIWYCTTCSCGFEIMSKDKRKNVCPRCNKKLIWYIKDNA